MSDVLGEGLSDPIGERAHALGAEAEGPAPANACELFNDLLYAVCGGHGRGQAQAE